MTDSYYHAHAVKNPAAPPLAGTYRDRDRHHRRRARRPGDRPVVDRAQPPGRAARGEVGRRRRFRPKRRYGFGRLRCIDTMLERAVGTTAARSLIGLSREAMALMRARIVQLRHPLRSGGRRRLASWFDDAAGLQAEVATMNDRFEMALEYWPSERLRAGPTPRHATGTGCSTPRASISTRWPLPRLRGRGRGRRADLFEGTPATALARGGGGWRRHHPRRRGHGPARGPVPERLYAGPVPALARATLPVFTYVMVTAPLAGRDAGVIRAPLPSTTTASPPATTACCPTAGCSGAAA